MTNSQITDKTKEPVSKPRGRKGRWGAALASTLGALGLVATMSTPAHADLLWKLPQNAWTLEQTYSPAMDYDKDACYTTAALQSDWRLNPGLPLKDSIIWGCRDYNRLEQSNHYSRPICNNGWCAIIYALYAEKDQTEDNKASGHTHDWEHVIVWVKDNVAWYVSHTAHGDWYSFSRSAVRWDPSGTHPKIVYHKDGPGTHALRLANSADDAVENGTGGWFYPRLVGWESGYPGGVNMRNHFVNANWGSAKLELKDDNMRAAVNEAKYDIFNYYGEWVGLDPYGPWLQ
ncbi:MULTISPECIES: NPP1 family protein [Streptomyces]|uniref:NPP1 family protein n=1 Tax=Streptomyces TaxID=1883 RepID=UPI0007C67C11|nr:NPP1 family protein [Streptomyces sp. AS58]